MNEIFQEKNRQVIPRWRDYQTTLKLGELNAFGNKINKVLLHDDNNLEKKKRDWKLNKSIPFAADLVNTAFILGKKTEAIEAAEFLLKSNASSLAKDVALKLLSDKKNEEEAIEPTFVFNKTLYYKKIHSLRNLLKRDPLNSIAWADLSRVYALIGLSEKARFSMEMALKLTFNNRYILRAASRLFLHLNDPQQAYDVLRRADITRVDPWVLASEIAVGSVIGRISKHIKIGKEMLDSGHFLPSQITELASALASIELYMGHNKEAKKFFKQSLDKPNDNSLAQACWASQTLITIPTLETIDVPRSYEAKSILFRKNLEWDYALKETLLWQLDQPFSSRPAVQGSYISATFLEEYEKSENIAKIGLAANPNDPVILNNLAFALACQNKIDEAENVFLQIKPNEDLRIKIVWNATKGLINFRKKGKNIEEGREYYNRAIELAAGDDYKKYKAIAAIYLAREEMFLKSEVFPEKRDFAIKLCEDLKDPEVDFLIKRTLYKNNTSRA